MGGKTHLDKLVTARRDNDRSRWVRGETDLGNPFSVTIFNQIVSAFTKSVPQLDGLIHSTGNDLTVIRGEGDGKNRVGVTDKTTDGLARVQVPKTQSLVPGSRETELTIRGHGDVGNKVVVTGHGATSNSELVVTAGDLPGDQSLVCE